MLHCTGKLAVEEASLTTFVALERTFRLVLVDQRGLRWDSRFGQRGPDASSAAGVSLLLEGWVHAHVPALGRIPAPIALCAGGAVLDGFAAGAHYLRGGERFRSIQIIETAPAPSDAPAGLRFGPIPPEVSVAAEALFAAIHEADPAPQVRALLVACAGAGLLSADPTPHMTAVEPEPLRRAWLPFATMYEDMGCFLGLKELAAAAGVSESQLRRDLDLLRDTFGLAWGGWRDLVNDLRLRRVVVMLSVPSLTAVEVARRTGYSGPDALATALRRAGLPSPAAIRAALREAPAG